MDVCPVAPTWATPPNPNYVTVFFGSPSATERRGVLLERLPRDSSNFLFKTASGNTPFAWNLADGCNTNPAIVVKGRQHLSPMRTMLPSLFP